MRYIAILLVLGFTVFVTSSCGLSDTKEQRESLTQEIFVDESNNQSILPNSAQSPIPEVQPKVLQSKDTVLYDSEKDGSLITNYLGYYGAPNTKFLNENTILVLDQNGSKVITDTGKVIKEGVYLPAISPDGKMLVNIAPYMNNANSFPLEPDSQHYAHDWLVEFYSTSDSSLLKSFQYSYVFTPEDTTLFFETMPTNGHDQSVMTNWLNNVYWLDGQTICIEGLAIWTIDISSGEIRRISDTWESNIGLLGPITSAPNHAELIGKYEDTIVYKFLLSKHSFRVYRKTADEKAVLLSDSVQGEFFVYQNKFYQFSYGDPKGDTIVYYDLNSNEWMDGEYIYAKSNGDLLVLFFEDKLLYYSNKFESPQEIFYPSGFTRTNYSLKYVSSIAFLSPELLYVRPYLCDLNRNEWYLVKGEREHYILETPSEWGRKIIETPESTALGEGLPFKIVRIEYVLP